MAEQDAGTVQLIRVSEIAVVNPRVRNKKSFRELVENISVLGLKKPITVSRSDGDDNSTYDLVCGQGRLEAFIELGEFEIPAFVIEATPEDRMVKSLVENCARRAHRAIDLLHDIGGMKQRGYSEFRDSQEDRAVVRIRSRRGAAPRQGGATPAASRRSWKHAG